MADYDAGSRMRSAIRLRFDATMRTMGLALRRHVRRTVRKRLAFVGYPGGIDRLEIRDGQIHVAGRTTARRLLIATELGSGLAVHTPRGSQDPHLPEARSFHMRLPGTERLSIEIDGTLVLFLNTARTVDLWLAGFRLLLHLSRLPFVHGRDLAAFLLRGDSAAGNRLEATLLPTPPVPSVPTAQPGLLRASHLTRITDPIGGPAGCEKLRPPEHQSGQRDLSSRGNDVDFGLRLAAALTKTGAMGRVPIYLAHRLGGGSEHWLASQVAKDSAAVVLRPAAELGWIRLELHGLMGPLHGDVPLEDAPEYLALLREKHLVYSCLVDPGDPLAIAETAVAALRPGDRFEVLFHDYFPLCPSYDLIGAEGAFCDLPDAGTCQACYQRLVRLTGTRPSTIAEWRARWHALIMRADVVKVFSVASRDLVSRVWPDLGGRLSVEPHLPAVLPRPVSPPDMAIPAVGVLGSISRGKGAAVLRSLAEHAEGQLRIVVIGAIDPAFTHPGIRVHGPYDREEISDLAELHRIDRWFIPAIWPETFSYTTHECLATGLPVFCFDLGAQGEAVARAQNGRLVKLGLQGEALVRVLTQ